VEEWLSILLIVAGNSLVEKDLQPSYTERKKKEKYNFKNFNYNIFISLTDFMCRNKNIYSAGLHICVKTLLS